MQAAGHFTLRSDGVPFAGDSLERSYLFYDRPSRLSSNAPTCRGQSRLSGFCCAHRHCIRSPCQHISRMRTFDNNSCAISITSPRSLFRPRTQHGRWGHREKSRRASTRWDCRGKSCLAGLSPLSVTPSERRVIGINAQYMSVLPLFKIRYPEINSENSWNFTKYPEILQNVPAFYQLYRMLLIPDFF